MTGSPGAPGAARVDTGDDGSVLMPVSMRFTAATLNTYDDPAASPVTVTDKAFEGAGRVNVDHKLADARRYCTT
jgi:hypothetical protein